VLWVMGVWREQLSPLAAVVYQWFMETYPPQVTYNAYYTELTGTAATAAAGAAGAATAAAGAAGAATAAAAGAGAATAAAGAQ
jgi:hypothetical protein